MQENNYENADLTKARQRLYGTGQFTRMHAAPLVIFFDAADTLFHVKGSVGEVYLTFARKYGVTVGREAIQQVFAKAFADAPPPVFAVSDLQEIKSCESL